MLPLLPLLHSDCASSSSALGSDWDIEDEIAKELRELGDSQVESTDSEVSSLQSQITAEAPVAVEALFAALSSGERYADKLAATLSELQSLPQQLISTTEAPQTASACEVRVAVAALQQCTGDALQQQPAADGLQGPHVAAERCQSGLEAAPQQSVPPATAAVQVQGCMPAAPVSLPEVQFVKSNAHDMCTQHLDAVKQQQCFQKELAPATSNATEQQQQGCVSPAHQPMQAASAQCGASKPQAQPASPSLPANIPPRSQLSPPHTPNTEDKRQNAATALLHQQQQQQQQDSQTLFCITPELSTDGEAAEALSEHVKQTPVKSQPASAAAEAIAEVQQAAADAARQRQHEQSQLQQLLEQQAAAAAARQAAQAAARQQLQQQAEAAAVSYMAAWRIAKAWQSYRSSPAHAQRLAAAVVLQAAARGAAARKQLQQMQTRQRLLSLLETAVASGHLEALTQAAEEAAAVGLQEEAQQAQQRYQASSQAAAADLQAAATTSSHAVFTAAAAAAAKYSTLTDACSSCAVLFAGRQEAAAQALQAAVAALPLPQVQRAVDAALELGLPGKVLAAALEAARARDVAASCRLSTAVKALTAQSDKALAQHTTCAALGAGAAPAGSSRGEAATSCSCNSGSVLDCSFDSSAFMDAVAACQQYGLAQEASAAVASLQRCRSQAAAKLAAAAAQSPCAECIQLLLHWCGHLGGLQQECAAAADVLTRRQRQLLTQLHGMLSASGSTAASGSTTAAGSPAESGSTTAAGNTTVAGSTSVPAVQQLLQEASTLGVSPTDLQPAQQWLQETRAKLQQRCWDAARSGTQQQLEGALADATTQGLDAQELQGCHVLMQERRQVAAGQLARSTAEVCAALQAGRAVDSLHLMEAIRDLMQGCVQLAAVGARSSPQHCSRADDTSSTSNNSSGNGTSSSGNRSSSSSSSSTECSASQQLEFETGSISRQLVELQQHAATCVSLGLLRNVESSVQAILQASRTASVGAVACYSQPLNAASGCSISPLAVSCSGEAEQQQQQQQRHLWEEGAVDEPQWCQSAVVQASLAPTFQLQKFVSCTQLGNNSSRGGSSGLTTAGDADQVEAMDCDTYATAVPFATPALQLQQQWAGNLHGALASMKQPLAGPQPLPTPTDRQQLQLQKQQIQQQHQQQQRCQASHSQPQGGLDGTHAPGWLHKLLGANAAVPLEQLTQLDLSLEQLPGLHGLDALCPQLMSMAVNMNGLSSLTGLEGCMSLTHLSAQDNHLQELPDISHHPHLTSLLLDSNKLRHIMPDAAGIVSCSSSSSSSSRSEGIVGDSGNVMFQQHSALQTLSLANNSITSICAGATDALECSSAAHGTGQLHGGNSSSSASAASKPHAGFSSSSSSGLLGCRVSGLSSWLVGLQCLRLPGNQLKNLTGLEGCSSLTKLDVSRNQLTCLQGLSGCHLLQHLDASDNKLSCFPAHLHLPLLQQLSLSCNAVTAWPGLPPLPHLMHLDLSDNQLQQLPDLHGLLQLKTLDLSFNALQNMQCTIAALQTAPQLQELRLHDNALHQHLQQQQQDAWEPPWLAGQAAARAAAAAAGADAGAGAELVTVEMWYRHRVAAGLPWLLKLDGDTVEPALRVPMGTPGRLQAPIWGLQQGPHHHHHQQQQQQQQLGGVGQVGLSNREHEESVAVATGRLLAGSGILSAMLLQQLRSGCVGGLGLCLPQQLAAAAAAGGGNGLGSIRAAAEDRWVVNMQAAAQWLPYLANMTHPYPAATIHQAAAAAEAGPWAASDKGAVTPQGLAAQQQLPCLHLQQAVQQQYGCRSCCRHSSGRNDGSSGCDCPASTHAAATAAAASNKGAVKLQGLTAQQQYRCSACRRHSKKPCNGSSRCDCPAWQLQAEAVWGYATHAWLVQTQAMQFTAASRACSSGRGLLAPGDSATADSATGQQLATPATAASANSLVALAKQHLRQLQQNACCFHQERLVEVQEYQAVAHEELRRAAVALQSIWRGHAVRHLYHQLWQQQREQSAAQAAATALQSLWRGVLARRAVAAVRQQQQEQEARAAAVAAVRQQEQEARGAAGAGAAAAAAAAGTAAALRQQQQEQEARTAAVAAVRIQAAVRGHKVRQRLKAALAAARSPTCAGGHAVGLYKLVPSQQQQGSELSNQVAGILQQQGVGSGPSQAGVEVCEEDWEFEGVPDDFLSMQSELLDDLLLPCHHPGAAEAAAAAPALSPALQQTNSQQQQQQQLQHGEDASMSRTPTGAVLTGGESTGSVGNAASSSEQAIGTAAGAADGVAAAAGVAATVALGRHSDSSYCGNASGSAQFEAKITALMEEWGFTDRATAEAYYKRQRHTLKAVAKHKLEQQLKDPNARLKRLQSQLGSGSAAGATAGIAAAAAAAAAVISDPNAAAAAVCVREAQRQPSLQQRSVASEGYKRSQSMPGGTSRAGSGRESSTSCARPLKQSSLGRTAARGLLVDSGDNSKLEGVGLTAALDSRLRQKEAEILPSLVLPQSGAASTAVGATTSRTGTAVLPKLHRGRC